MQGRKTFEYSAWRERHESESPDVGLAYGADYWVTLLCGTAYLTQPFTSSNWFDPPEELERLMREESRSSDLRSSGPLETAG